MKKQISIIVAIAENFAIGKNNDLLWHISDDLKHFKKITSHNPVIMGKKTFLSLPIRPLPNRKNIVITDIPDEIINGCTMAYSIEHAIEMMETDKENFIIGGASVYSQFLPYTDKLYLTRVHQSYDADVFFPKINFNEWQKVFEEHHIDENNNGLRFTFQEFIRK